MAALAFAIPAHAACGMPGGAPNAQAGDIAYNIDEAVMQYCNGANWINMGGGGGGGGSMPVCADNEILRYDDGDDEWDCVAMASAEVDPQVNTLTNNKWCTSNGTVINCASDLPIGTLTNAKFCTTNGTTITCTSDGPAETDPQVGTLTNGKLCTTNGSIVNCTADEADPKVGAVTNNKWCRGNGTAVVCDQDAPSGGGVNVQTFDSSGTWTKPGSGSIAMIECWGGGGGGGRGDAATGGGGGGYNMKWTPLASLGASETVTIGAGGTGRAGSNGAGGQGGNTTFGAHLTAYGGGPGGHNASSAGGGGGVLSAGGNGHRPRPQGGEVA